MNLKITTTQDLSPKENKASSVECRKGHVCHRGTIIT